VTSTSRSPQTDTSDALSAEAPEQDDQATDPGERHKKAVHAATRVLARPSATIPLRERLDGLVRHAGEVYDLDSPTDTYGDGIVAALEDRVAGMLGKEAAAFFPTGTMAQQVVLRCWAERSGDRRVALHALSHPEVFEANAFRRVSRLIPVRIAGGPQQITADDVRSVREPFGALMLELPLRDAGYLLPSWDELVAVTAAARERGAVVHIDGARLWETTTHLGHDLAEVAALADTVYVSFYKSLDGLSGAAVAGDRSIIDETRVWRHRYGGRVFQQFPVALSALIGLERELPRLAEYVAQAKVVAAALGEGFAEAGIGWSKVQPAQPHIHQFQVWLPFEPDALMAAATRQAEETGVSIFQLPWWSPGLPPGISVTEVTVSEAALGWTADEVRAATVDFISYLPR
jgi:threonine aldolase